MIKTIYRICVIACLFCVVPAHAQKVILDRFWYLSGEKMTVAVEVSNNEEASKVAYIELCDANGLQANAVVSLTNGRGQGYVYLPPTMHSGYYQLNMYTRVGKQASNKLVPVVNTLQRFATDDIDWQETSSDHSFVSKDSLFDAMDGKDVSIPSEYVKRYGQREENDGHCIYARIHRSVGSIDSNSSQIETMLSVIGREMHVFNGKLLDDSTVVFNTYNVHGRHSIVLTARTYSGNTMPIEVLAPFANILPKQLPHLVFNYNREEVEKRSIQMQMAVGDTMVVDSTVFSDEIFSTKPVTSYNLDEYRQFHTLREVLLEYVTFVHRGENNGHNQLFVHDGSEDNPALVLIDGMPVHDIDRLLKYDARRVKHISIYDDYYTIGEMIYKGIVNIVTRTGKLTNFPPEQDAAYLIYDFPQ